jgi:hypothetical protein
LSFLSSGQPDDEPVWPKLVANVLAQSNVVF